MRFLIATLTFGLLLPSLLLGQESPWALPHAQLFTDVDGLPQASVERIAYDSQGKLWICTRDGAAFYDGLSWTIVDMPNPTLSNWPRTLAAAPDGSIWFGTESDGLHRLDRDDWSSWSVDDGLPANKVRTLHFMEGNDAKPWVGTNNGLATFEGETWRSVEELEGSVVYDLATTKNPGEPASLWAGTNSNQLFERTPSGKWQIHTAPGVSEIFTLTVDRLNPGNLWVGTNIGLFSFDLKTHLWKRFNRGEGAPTTLIRSILELVRPDGSQELWVGTGGEGVLSFRDGVWSTVALHPSLPQAHVFQMVRPPFGPTPHHLWIGTLSGLLRLDLGGWKHSNQSTGLPADSVVSLLSYTQDQKRWLWFGTIGGGAKGFDGNHWTSLSTAEGMPDNSVFAMAHTKEGLWLGTNNSLVRYSDGTLESWGQEDGLPIGSVVAILPQLENDGSTSLLLGSYGGGLTRWSHGQLTPYLKPEELPDGRIEALMTTDSLQGPILWIATDGGLVEKRRDYLKIHDRETGLPNALVRSIRTWSIGNQQFLVVGTSGGFAWRSLTQQNTRWSIMDTSTEPALPNNVIYRMEEDGQGRLYLGTSRGVIRLTPKNSNPRLPSDFEVSIYTTNDGLPSNEINFGASTVDEDGRIWFGTPKGATSFSPEAEVIDNFSKPLHLLSIEINGDRFPTDTPPGPLKYSQNNLEFSYRLFTTFHAEQSRYQSQLVGYEDFPTPWSTETKRVFTNLPAGRYSLVIWAKDYKNNPSDPLQFTFEIRQAPWKTPWAFTAYIAAVVFMIWLLFRLRLRTLKVRNLHLTATVAERTQELNEKLQALERAEKQSREAREELESAHEAIERLTKQSPQSFIDQESWISAVAQEIEVSLRIRDLAVFVYQRDEPTCLTGSGAICPLRSELRSSLGDEQWLQTQQGTIIPCEGLSGDITGVMVIPSRWGPWENTERRLLTSYAHHLGAGLELHEMRITLLEAEARQVEARRQLQDRGVELLQICPLCDRCYGDEEDECPRDGEALRLEHAVPRVVENRYTIRRVIGRGAMGRVYLAHDSRTERDVAIKVLSSETYTQTHAALRLEQEIRVVSRLSHPGIVQIYDAGVLPDHSRFLVMELLDGADLSRILSVQGRGSLPQVASLVQEVGAALQVAHDTGLIHRDLKPQNLFLHRTNGHFKAKILDFGLAKEIGEEKGLTRSGIVVGTPPYMSPEQLKDQNLDARSDLFTFAAVAFEALTGRRTTTSTKLADIFIETLHQDPPPPSRLRPQLTPEVDQLFRDALAKEAALRPLRISQWANQLAKELRSLEDSVRGWDLEDKKSLADAPWMGAITLPPTTAEEPYKNHS